MSRSRDAELMNVAATFATPLDAELARLVREPGGARATNLGLPNNAVLRGPPLAPAAC